MKKRAIVFRKRSRRLLVSGNKRLLSVICEFAWQIGRDGSQRQVDRLTQACVLNHFVDAFITVNANRLEWASAQLGQYAQRRGLSHEAVGSLIRGVDECDRLIDERRPRRRRARCSQFGQRRNAG